MVAMQGRVAVSPIWMERLLGSDCGITVCAVCVGVCASIDIDIRGKNRKVCAGCHTTQGTCLALDLVSSHT